MPDTPTEAVESLCATKATSYLPVPMGDDRIVLPLSVLINFTREQREASRREGVEATFDYFGLQAKADTVDTVLATDDQEDK